MHCRNPQLATTGLSSPTLLQAIIRQWVWVGLGTRLSHCQLQISRPRPGGGMGVQARDNKHILRRFRTLLIMLQTILAGRDSQDETKHPESNGEGCAIRIAKQPRACMAGYGVARARNLSGPAKTGPPGPAPTPMAACFGMNRHACMGIPRYIRSI